MVVGLADSADKKYLFPLSLGGKKDKTSRNLFLLFTKK